MRITPLQTDETILRELGRRLSRARLDRNLTQQQVAARSGIGTATLERLEAGVPSKLPTLIRVLRALDLLDGLESLVPTGTGPSPLDLATRGRERQRARPAGSRSRPERPGRQPWGDEQ